MRHLGFALIEIAERNAANEYNEIVKLKKDTANAIYKKRSQMYFDILHAIHQCLFGCVYCLTPMGTVDTQSKEFSKWYGALWFEMKNRYPGGGIRHPNFLQDAKKELMLDIYVAHSDRTSRWYGPE